MIQSNAITHQVTNVFMKAYLFKIYFLGILLVLAASTQAQKNIIISDSLAANAEKLNVNMGSLWMGKIRKFSFGDYAIVSSKGMGVTTESPKSNLFNTRTESRSSKRFSFVLSTKTTDSASVNAGARNIMIQSLRKIMLGNGWSVGSDELAESNNLTALITINRDTTDTWVLFMGGTSRNGVGNYQAYLTNGGRKVLLTLASSNKEVQHIGVRDALGYEFIENGRSLCALQYFGGLGKPTNIVWLHRSLDAKMKLVLASTMTAVLLEQSPSSPIN